MVELEETFITQLQRVADTYKREMQEQHSIRSDLEVRPGVRMHRQLCIPSRYTALPF